MFQFQKATIILATILLTITNHRHPTVVQAQSPTTETEEATTSTTIKNFNYTPEECTSWVSAAIASDTDQSGGLSQSEFMYLLSSILPNSIYFNSTTTFNTLPFKVQLAHPTLACWCEELGQGTDCCKGPDPKIDVSVLVEENPSQVASYREDFCAFVNLVVVELSSPTIEATTTTTTTTVATTTTAASSSAGATATTTTATISATTTTTNPTAPTDPITFTIIGSVIDYSSYPYTQIFDDSPIDKLPSFTTANDILSNSESRQGVIGQLIMGFTSLSLGMLQQCPVEIVEENKKRTSSEPVQTTVLQPGLLGSLDETEVNDIKCPEGLPYAPPDAFCVEFIVTMKPSAGLAEYDGVRTCLVENINSAIENGELYNIIEKNSSGKTQTIMGLGSPGAGVNYEKGEGNGNYGGDVQFGNTGDTNNRSSSDGLSGGLIFLIILALFAIPLVTLAILRHRGKQAEELARVREFAGEPAKDVDLENPPVIVPVVAKGGEEEEEKEEEKQRDDDDDSSAPSVWSESRDSQDVVVDDDNSANPATPSKLGSSLAAMGVASTVATNLYEKKNAAGNKDEEEAKDLEAITAEVRSLVDKTAPGKTAEELLSAYAGREEELLGHLRRLDRETSRS